MKTTSTRKEDVVRRWFVVDAENMVLGRISTEIASILRGKTKPTYTPHVDTGDFVIVINAEKVVLTGNKENGKIYYRHTGWMGGLKSTTAAKLRETKPEQIIYHSVKGMLPRGPLGSDMFGKLKVYAGPEHPHAAQKPESITFERAKRL